MKEELDLGERRQRQRARGDKGKERDVVSSSSRPSAALKEKPIKRNKC